MHRMYKLNSSAVILCRVLTKIILERPVVELSEEGKLHIHESVVLYETFIYQFHKKKKILTDNPPYLSYGLLVLDRDWGTIGGGS